MGQNWTADQNLSSSFQTTIVYMTNDLTNEPKNHRHAFIGTNQGDILFFDTEAMVFSKYIITLYKVFKDLKEFNMSEIAYLRIVDIKCHAQKMHRILIAYQSHAIVVWSMNKNKVVAVQNTTELVKEKGNVLAIEWLSDLEYLVAFENGDLNVFREEDKTNKIIRTLKFPAQESYKQFI